MSKLRHLLIYEPRLGGHHLTWLKYVTEDFLSAGIRLTLAVDLRDNSKELLTTKFANLASELNMLSAYTQDGKYKGGSKIASLRLCLKESGAQEVFMTNFDEIASATLRKAAIGIMPPQDLREKLSGIYFRPRFMECCWSLGNMIKQLGFTRLCNGGWIKNLYLLDEYVIDKAVTKWNHCNFLFLPDVWSLDYSQNQELARTKLKIPADKFVYLNYGIGTRRKGLHLVIRAMLSSAPPKGIFLLCAGEVAEDKELKEGVAELEKRGLALVINNYVSDEEEELCFAACDVVLLPYVKHFGSSGVLSRAAAAGKMVVASNEGLVAKRVKEHKLGLLFQSENIHSLREAMAMSIELTKEKREEYRKNSYKYSVSCSRKNFRQVLIRPFCLCDNKKSMSC